MIIMGRQGGERREGSEKRPGKPTTFPIIKSFPEIKGRKGGERKRKALGQRFFRIEEKGKRKERNQGGWEKHCSVFAAYCSARKEGEERGRREKDHGRDLR